MRGLILTLVVMYYYSIIQYHYSLKINALGRTLNWPVTIPVLHNLKLNENEIDAKHDIYNGLCYAKIEICSVSLRHHNAMESFATLKKLVNSKFIIGVSSVANETQVRQI